MYKNCSNTVITPLITYITYIGPTEYYVEEGPAYYLPEGPAALS